MKLIDYLPYYLGCDVITTDDNETAEIVGVTDDDAHLVHKGTGSYGTCSVEGIKPILRKLEDMTDEQAVELVKLVVHENEFTNVSTYRHNFTNDLMVQWGYLTPAQRSDDVEYFFNATGERSWSAAQFQYLLRQHFDLFNLIDTGLAVYIKTIGS